MELKEKGDRFIFRAKKRTDLFSGAPRTCGEGSGLTFYIGLMSGMSILRPDLKAFLIRG